MAKMGFKWCEDPEWSDPTNDPMEEIEVKVDYSCDCERTIKEIEKLRDLSLFITAVCVNCGKRWHTNGETGGMRYDGQNKELFPGMNIVDDHG